MKLLLNLRRKKMKIDKAKVKYTPTPEKVFNTRASTYTEEFRGEFFNINVNKLIPFKNQARQNFDEESLNDLAATIKEHGIRQPLTIVPSEKEGMFEVVSGERRLRAALILNFSTVPCIIIHDKNKAEEIALIENVQRKNLHPLELLNAFMNLLSSGICTSQSQISEKIGIQRSSVVEIFNLQKLDNSVKEKLLVDQIKSRSLFRHLCKLPVDQQMKELDKYLKTNLIQSDEIQPINIKNALKSKSQILNIVLTNDEELVLNVNKIGILNPALRSKLKTILETLISI